MLCPHFLQINIRSFSFIYYSVWEGVLLPLRLVFGNGSQEPMPLSVPVVYYQFLQNLVRSHIVKHLVVGLMVPSGYDTKVSIVVLSASTTRNNVMGARVFHCSFSLFFILHSSWDIRIVSLIFLSQTQTEMWSSFR